MNSLLTPTQKEENPLPIVGLWMPMNDSIKNAVAYALNQPAKNETKISELISQIFNSPPQVKNISDYLKS
jgi:hypothetical protein